MSRMRYLKRIIVLIYIISFFSSFAFAKENFLFYKKFRLPNGMTVILKEDHSHPLVSVNIYVKASSLTEDEKISGISHFCEHMFYRGTHLRSGIQIKRGIETLGGATNAETNKDFTRYFVDIPSNYLKNILEILSDALINSKFSPSDIESERKVILEEYNLHSSSPLSCIYTDLYELAFEEHPYRMPVIGTRQNLESFKREDLLSYKNKFYVPQNISLVLVGDFDAQSILPVIKDYFGGMPSSGAVSPSCKVRNITSSKTKVEEKDTSEPLMVIGYPTPGILEASASIIYPLDILTFILGQGEGSILRQLKEKYKISMISADFITSKEPGLFIITASSGKEHFEKAKGAIFEEIEKLKGGELSDDDFQRGKNFLINTYIFQNETNSGKASTIGFYEAIYDSSFASYYLDRIEEVKKEDVLLAAKEIFSKNYTCIIYMPR